MSSRLSVGSVTAVALAYQAVSGSASATAQTANQPTGQTNTSPNLPSINVQAPAPKRRKPAQPASVPAAPAPPKPTPTASPPQLQPTQTAPGAGMSDLSTAAAALPAGTTTLDARQSHKPRSQVTATFSVHCRALRCPTTGKAPSATDCRCAAIPTRAWSGHRLLHRRRSGE
jgi:hypothetical protein